MARDFAQHRRAAQLAGPAPHAVQAWRGYAAQQIPLDDAVEAQALAQLLDIESAEQVEIVRTVYPCATSNRCWLN